MAMGTAGTQEPPHSPPVGTRTLVPLRLARGLGLGDGVVDAAVLPRPLRPADALALVAANLPGGRCQPPGSLLCVPPPARPRVPHPVVEADLPVPAAGAGAEVKGAGGKAFVVETQHAGAAGRPVLHVAQVRAVHQLHVAAPAPAQQERVTPGRAPRAGVPVPVAAALAPTCSPRSGSGGRRWWWRSRRSARPAGARPRCWRRGGSRRGRPCEAPPASPGWHSGTATGGHGADGAHSLLVALQPAQPLAPAVAPLGPLHVELLVAEALG